MPLGAAHQACCTGTAPPLQPASLCSCNLPAREQAHLLQPVLAGSAAVDAGREVLGQPLGQEGLQLQIRQSQRRVGMPLLQGLQPQSADLLPLLVPSSHGLQRGCFPPVHPWAVGAAAEVRPLQQLLCIAPQQLLFGLQVATAVQWVRGDRWQSIVAGVKEAAEAVGSGRRWRLGSGQRRALLLAPAGSLRTAAAPAS